jgi:flagellin
MISLMTNVDSLVAQQNLNVNSQFQSNTIDQLTSGYRINSSADDAAGLSVANGYRNQIAELNQGVLNANQGVSQLQIVDGGLSNISQMLDRLQTLATESASQTFTGNRGTLETEYSGLLGEIDRQADNVGLGDTNTSNSANLAVYIGGGQSAQDNSSVSVDLAGQSVSSTGLGLANTGVLNTPPATLGSTAATLIAANAVDSFTVDTAAGSNTVSVTGAAGDTIAGQVTELNAGLAAYGITASLNSSNEIQLQSSSAFTVKATSAGLTATGDKAVNTGLYNAEYATVTTADALTITSGSQTASCHPERHGHYRPGPGGSNQCGSHSRWHNRNRRGCGRRQRRQYQPARLQHFHHGYHRHWHHSGHHCPYRHRRQSDRGHQRHHRSGPDPGHRRKVSSARVRTSSTTPSAWRRRRSPTSPRRSRRSATPTSPRKPPT